MDKVMKIKELFRTKPIMASIYGGLATFFFGRLAQIHFGESGVLVVLGLVFVFCAAVEAIIFIDRNA